MRCLTTLFRRPARSVVRRSSLTLESLEDRRLLSAAPVTGTVVKEVASGMYKFDHQINTADAIMLFKIVDGADKVVISSKSITISPAAHTPTTGTVSAGALKALDAIFDNPTDWGITATLASQGEQVLGSVKAGESVSKMQHVVDEVFNITSQGSNPGNTPPPGDWNHIENNPLANSPV
jgi:hypothetical protein